MEYLIRRDNKRFTLALALSVALHVVALIIKLSSPDGTLHGASPLAVTLAKPRASPRSMPEQPKQARQAEPPPVPSPRRPKELLIAPAAETEKTWSRAEKDEMNQFLSELGGKPRPPLSGRELAQRALAASRSIPEPEEEGKDEMAEMRQKLMDAKVDPFSLEMYFDALFRKMNRSAAMVRNEPRARGKHVAVVRVVVGQDGAMKSFRVLWAADQQAEIAYIKAVMDQASPFPVFPSDIRTATDSIVLQICIQPGRFGSGGGAAFTRMSKGQSCREADSG